jgi:uncharacterized protein YjbI with pentapeptide repeats
MASLHPHSASRRGHARIGAPRLFISYSRQDFELADRLAGELARAGSAVFLDTEGIDPGENFVTRLQREIDRATAVVAVVTAHYAASRWAQAELYYAYSSRKLIIPVVVGAWPGLDPPLDRLLQDTQRVSYSPNDPRDQLAGPLAKARHRRRGDLAVRSAPWIVTLAALGMLAWWSVEHLNALEIANRRESVVQEVAGASSVLPSQRAADLAARVPGDAETIARLQLMALDRTRPEAARFNAAMLAGQMSGSRTTQRRAIRDLRLDHVALRDNVIANVTFARATWQDVAIVDSVLAGVFFAAEDRFQLGSSRFENVEFLGGGFGPIVAVGVDFVDTKFRGAEIDTTNFSGVRFVTTNRKIEEQPVISARFAMIDRSVVISRRTPPAPSVLDLSRPGSDVVFKGVVFSDCRLEGYFRADWFTDCDFEHCMLPPGLAEALVRKGNTVR